MLKKNYLSLFLLFNIILSFSQNRKVIELSEGWKFQKGNPENASQIEFNDTSVTSIQPSDLITSNAYCLFYKKVK